MESLSKNPITRQMPISKNPITRQMPISKNSTTRQMSISKNSTRQKSQQCARKVTFQEISPSTWYRLKYKIQLIHSKGALLMMWVTLTYYVYWYSLTGEQLNRYIQNFSGSEEIYYYLYLHLVLLLLTPLFGWIADAWIGRYKVILCSLVVGLLGCIIISVEIIVSNYPSLNEITIALLYISEFIISLAITAFHANTLPFITDQMIGASGAELSAAVDWYFWIVTVPLATTTVICCYCDDLTNTVVSVFLYTIGIALSFSSILVCPHWLITDPHITNPIKHIASVLNFARKNKYPRNRSALTYWEDTFPSRLDLGKDKYGGPFTEEGVENVKTFLMLIPLTFVSSLGGLAIHVNSQDIHMDRNNLDVQCILSNEDLIAALIIVFGIPFFHLIVKHRISFSMLKIIGLGFVLYLIGCLCLSFIEFIGHRMNHNATCLFDVPVSVIPIDYGWALLPLLLKGMGSIIVGITLVKFLIAQSPHQIKGLLYGCYYAFNGIAKVIGYNLYRPFKLLHHTTPSCGFYYYITQSIILTVILILFIIVSKWYKLRMRNNPININLIVADHVEKHIHQRKEHTQSLSDSYGATDDSLIINN